MSSNMAESICWPRLSVAIVCLCFFMPCLILIALLGYSAGFVTRYILHNDPTNLSVYIAENMFITLSPCGFIASSYMLLGRLAALLNSGQYLLVRPSRVTKVFVMSDVITFLIQVCPSDFLYTHPNTGVMFIRRVAEGWQLVITPACLTSAQRYALASPHSQRH